MWTTVIRISKQPDTGAFADQKNPLSFHALPAPDASSETQGLLVGTMQYFSGKRLFEGQKGSSALQINFRAAIFFGRQFIWRAEGLFCPSNKLSPEKYRILSTNSPWVSENVPDTGSLKEYLVW